MNKKKIVGLLLIGMSLAVTQTLAVDDVIQNKLRDRGGAFQEKESWVIKDPIATYHGNVVRKEDFLNFMEAMGGQRLEEVSSKEYLQDLVSRYLIYESLIAEAQEKGVDQDVFFLEMREIALNFFIAHVSLAQEIVTFKDVDEMPLTLRDDLSLEAIYEVAVNLGMRLSKSAIKDHEMFKEDILTEYSRIEAIANIGRHNLQIQNPEFLEKEKYQEKVILANFYIQKLLDEMSISDEELQKAYEQWLEEIDHNEYKASHIYLGLEDQKLGENILKQLESGEMTFTEAVNLYSIDEHSKKFDGRVGGGDWVTFRDPHHPFIKGLKALSVGEYTDYLVKGDNGYHIIMLNGQRMNDYPALKDVKDNVVFWWKNHRLEKKYKRYHDDMKDFLILF